ncbi:Carbohydrate esterase family 8 protein [Mycena indigotica]|uniref:pectinesterase n=1 Tax=Mycena indigotica TaxID=2126181 RepID=A0A8H6VZH4_9AGAR|nr:Carbohydrate esterase family 8 protein [Mycena indigotica]KAF7299447.1 Carbohydrate esterase family 8 protein [Mycena indigotica]
MNRKLSAARTIPPVDKSRSRWAASNETVFISYTRRLIILSNSMHRPSFYLAMQFSFVHALSPTYYNCQVEKPQSISPLLGCPTNTIFVSQDVSNPYATFNSIQSAIESLPGEGAATILIGAGSYHETVNISRNGPLTLLGQLPANATLAAKPFANPTSANMNLVQIWNNNFVMSGQDDASSAVLTVAPNLAAALIGAGPTGAPLQPVFGNVNFKAYNIDIQNRAANFAISQALATDISYANASFYGCSFASFQDTWYTGRNASTYMVDSVVFGQTDYLFGFGTAWFQNTIFANRACGGGLVAWKGTNLTDAPRNRYGAYISDSKIIRSPDANATTVTTNSCFLGRPWNDLAVTVFLSTFMDQSIRSAGFEPFNSARPAILNTTFYAEFNSSGPGGNTAGRVSVEHILTAADVKAQDFTVDGVFLEHPKWIDFEYLF